MRHKTLVRYLMIVSVLTLIGCRNSSTSPDPGVASSGNTGNAAATASDANSNGAAYSSAPNAPESAPPPAAAPKPVVVKAGNKIVITADESVSSKTSNSGDHFDASIAEPVVVGDRVVIPKGAKATGTVTEAKSAGKFKGNAAITVTLRSDHGARRRIPAENDGSNRVRQGTREAHRSRRRRRRGCGRHYWRPCRRRQGCSNRCRRRSRRRDRGCVVYRR